METTTINIPIKLLPLWKTIEGLSEKDRNAILVIVNNYKTKHSNNKLGDEHLSYNDPSQKYYISPEIRALQTNFKPSENLSLDYKNELGEALAEKFL